MKLLNFLTGRRCAADRPVRMGISAVFSRVQAAAAVRPAPVMKPDGFPSPNSRAAELVREFLVARVAGGGGLKELAVGLGREPKRIYHEAEGDTVLSWDFVDRAGGSMDFEARLILARFLMDRWGFRVEVGHLPGLPGLEERQ